MVELLGHLSCVRRGILFGSSHIAGYPETSLEEMRVQPIFAETSFPTSGLSRSFRGNHIDENCVYQALARVGR
jgi:hypothetical protein